VPRYLQELLQVLFYHRHVQRTADFFIVGLLAVLLLSSTARAYGLTAARGDAGPRTHITLGVDQVRAEPLKLLVYREYASLIDAAVCDWRFMEQVAQAQQRDIALFYYSAEEALALTLAGEADGLYYVSAALGHHIPQLLTVEHSQIRDPMSAYLKEGGSEVTTFGHLKGRNVTYLPGFLGFDRLVAGGFFGPGSMAARGVPEMVRLVEEDVVEAMFVISKFQPLVNHLAMSLKGVTFRMIPTPQEASLFIYLSPLKHDKQVSLDAAFRQVKLDQGVGYGIDPFHCD